MSIPLLPVVLGSRLLISSNTSLLLSDTEITIDLPALLADFSPTTPTAEALYTQTIPKFQRIRFGNYILGVGLSEYTAKEWVPNDTGTGYYKLCNLLHLIVSFQNPDNKELSPVQKKELGGYNLMFLDKKAVVFSSPKELLIESHSATVDFDLLSSYYTNPNPLTLIFVPAEKTVDLSLQRTFRFAANGQQQIER